MAALNHDVEGLLRSAGLRSTRQRLALGALLFDGTHKHVTAEQVFALARKKRVPVSLATVYNTLHQFTEAGLLHQVTIDPTRVYFDTHTGPHHHFYDETTGCLTDVDDSSVKLARLPPPPPGTKLQGVDVIIRVTRA